MHDDRMGQNRVGQIAVTFLSRRNGADAGGYGAAADAMEALAKCQPGYCGFETARGADGFGVTISFWADDASAMKWRDHPDHRAIRDAGRASWYDAYEVIVSRVERGYRWRRG